MFWEEVKEFFGAETDEEKVLVELKNALEKSSKLCETAAVVVSDREKTQKLSSVSENLKGAANKIDKGLEIRGAVRDIVKFIDAVEELKKVDVGKEPSKAAEAFGNLFSCAGKLGKRLPKGPWTGYFEFISNMKDFFSNVERGLIPEQRERERKMFESLDK